MRYHLFAAAALIAATPFVPQAASAQAGVSVPSSVPDSVFSGQRSREVLAAQVLLDRSRHSPGVIDGYMGGNTARAIRAYQRANGLSVTGELDDALLERLRSENGGELLKRYTLTQEDVSGPFVDVPSSMTGKAKLDRVAYERPSEKIAEKFHMDEDFLRALNPNAAFGSAGTEIVVVAGRDDSGLSAVARVEIDKSRNAVRAYADGGKLLATYPATVGSSTFPSPNGAMEVRAVAPDATYHFSPEGRDWGPDEKLTIAAGPNNPVGGIWIDLTKDGYGIHGSPDPHLIGKTNSHGCVRLTNWDAEELAQAVSQGTKVEFV